MADLRVTPSQLAELAGAVSRVSAQVRDEHQGLKARLAPLFGTDWSGAAAGQFTALYEQFDAHARGMSDALDGIGALLARAGTAYADVEAQIAASFH